MCGKVDYKVYRKQFGEIITTRNSRLFLYVIFFSLILLNVNKIQAQAPGSETYKLDTANYDSLYIDKIFIIGNKRTKPKIIQRELDFKDGDMVLTDGFSERIKKNEEKLINTRLFLSAKISLIEVYGNRVDVIIRLVERWYIFPIPILELADRNFKDWWVNQNHSFSRIEWGLKLYIYNMRGRNETLKLSGQLGFTKAFQIAYSFPSIDKKQKIGLNVAFGYRLNKNIFYNTVYNKRIFLNSNDWLLEGFSGGISTTYRKSFYSIHTLGANYYNSHVNDTIVELNSNYYGEGQSQQEYVRLFYSYVLDKRDITSYPLKGSYLTVRLDQSGLGFKGNVNKFTVSAIYDRYFNLGKNFYLSGTVGGRLSTPVRQSYIQYNAMGLGRFTLRGYELYVIEGPKFIQNQWTVRKLLFKTQQNLKSILSARQLRSFHMAIYLKSYFDLGYVEGYPENFQNERLTDTWIYGYGAGIDIVTIYDLVLRFEYSFNKEGESGFVFGFRSNF